MVVAEQVQEVQTRHKTQFWSSSNFVLMFKLHPIFYSVAPKCKTSPALNINFSCIRFPSDGPLLNKASKKVPTQKLKIMKIIEKIFDPRENACPNQSQIGGLDGEPLSNGFTTIGPDLDVFSLLVAF